VETAAQQDRISGLEEMLLQANQDYYNGTPSVPDEVYDAWRDELRDLAPDSKVLKDIGAPPNSEWAKVRHEHTMGSLGKVNTAEELEKWASGVRQTSEELLLITEKLDGISISLRYEQGKLVLGSTRGDGTIGEDITANVRRMKSVPATVPVKDKLTVRGEIVLLKADFDQHFQDMANTRNAASGTAKRTSGKRVEHLSVLTYQIIEGVEVKTEKDQLLKLEELGFKTPHWTLVSTTRDVNSVWQKYEDTLRDALPYEIDGLVVRFNDLTRQLALGDVHGRPNGAVAYKFTPPARETQLLDILWQVGGTGRITPVAVFEPVNLVGAEVTRASLYNHAYITQLGVDIGARILVVRANDVIPRVTRVVTSTGTVAKSPQACPSCGTATSQDGLYLVCRNLAECPAQTVGRLKAWVRELRILEWGESLLVKLSEAGLVRNVADLYRLKKETLANLDRMADKSAENVLKTLWAANPVPLENLLGGLSIPLCATSIIKLVIDAGHDTLEKIQALTHPQLLAIAGLGPKRADAIFEGLRKNQHLLADLLANGVTIKTRTVGNLTGKSVCFTGSSVRKRAVLETMVADAGGTVKGTVGKGLTYLVLADPNSTTSKAVAARKHGTTCLSEEDFVSMCGGT
jgi:DNA ligase (NAD+)